MLNNEMFNSLKRLTLRRQVITALLLVSMLGLSARVLFSFRNDQQEWSGPDFIVVGAMKAGTTSLYAYLTHHPDIRPAARKQIHYFDKNFAKGWDWYQSQFPKHKNGEGFLVGEATPFYCCHPLALERIHTHCPNAKILMILRDPIERAFSHYNYLNRQGRADPLPFHEALFKEPERLAGERERIIAEAPHYYSKIYRDDSYIERGKYIKQIRRLYALFPQDQVLLIDSEDLKQKPKETLNRVFTFLRLTPHTLNEYQKYNAAPKDGTKIDPKIRAYLADQFRPYNEELQQFLRDELELDMELNWN
jgi:hypothetical protein